MRMNPSLSERPLELINHICSFLDSPKDLLSFSLTSRRICATAIPNHIECRHIRCDVRCVSLWNRLADLPWIASQFVSLEIIGRFESVALTRPIIPNHHPLLAIAESESSITTRWQEEPREECWSGCIRALTAAVRVMSGLRSFRWIDREESYSINDVFGALKNCSRLDNIQIVINPEFDDEDEPYICYSPLWDLSDLRIFSFNYDMTGNMDLNYINKYTKNMLNMLIHRAPGLEDLHLDLGDSEVDVGELFQHGCWPMLKRLTIASDILMPEDDTMDRFLNAHPTLEHISIPRLSEVKAVRWMENVPCLRGLSCADPRNLKSAISRHGFKFLEYIALDLSYSSATGNFCLQFLSQITSLRRLTLRGGQSPPGLLSEVARAVPQLERLHFNHYDGWESPTVAKIINDEDGAFSTRVTVLSHFRHLTHLSRFICLDQSPDGSVSNEVAVTELVAQRCATACPVLKYINLPTERRISGTRSWITIERNDDSSYARWKPTDDSEKAALEVETWGGFFLGAQQSYMSRYLR